MNNFLRLKITIGIFFVITLKINAQTFNDAERLFGDKIAFSVRASYNFNNWENGLLNPSIITYSENDYSSRGLGIDWNYAQSGKFNFLLGLYVRDMKSTRNFVLAGNRVGAQRDFRLNENRNLTSLVLNANFEFVQQIDKNIFLSIYLGPQLMRQINGIETERGFVIRDDDSEFIAVRNWTGRSLFDIGVNYGLGLYYNTSNSGFFKIDFTLNRYNYLPNAGSYLRVRNLDIGFESDTSHLWLSNSATLSLSWSPPKNWFQKKQ